MPNGFIVAGDTAYLNLRKTLASQVHCGKLVPFFGAGISAAPPACLPLAKPLCRSLVDAMLESVKHSFGESLSAGQLRALTMALESQPLEKLLDALVSVHGQAALQFLDCLDGRRCNPNHLMLARLSRHGYVNRIITLNFDLLIETALSQESVDFQVQCPLTEAASYLSGPREASVHILKPHGTFSVKDGRGSTTSWLGATLREIGSRPARENVRAIKRVLGDNCTLLVAGYSDGDWDISPILCELNEELSNVVWVEYISERDVHLRRPKEVCANVASWLKRLGDKGHLFYGDIAVLLSDLSADCKVEIDKCSSITGTPPPIDNSMFLRHPLRTAFAAGTLVRDAELAAQYAMLDMLEAMPRVQDDVHLYGLLLRAQAWRRHTERDYRTAITLRKRAMAIELRSEEPSPQVIASDNISLGYEYVCCAKRPYADSVLSLLLWPGFLAFGLLHLRRGRIQSRSRHEKALAGFYVIDLAHNWASILLLVGHLRLVWLRKVIFGWIARAYCRLLRCFPKEMNWEYFYIRYLESRILAGRAPRGFRTQRKLEWIRHMFQCTQQPGHVRNVEAMLAFLAFVKDPYSPGIALHLKEARRGLNRRSPPTVRLRLLLFRRFLEPRRVSLGRALCLAWRYSVPRKITGAHA